jgi:hypothetical protein
MCADSQRNGGSDGVFDIERMRKCLPLLPEPGGEVVRECLVEIERLRALVESPTLEKAAKIYVPVDGRFLVGCLALEPGNEPISLHVRMSMNEMIRVAKEQHRLFRIGSVEWSSDDMTAVIRLEPDIGIRFLNELPADIKVIDTVTPPTEIGPLDMGPVHCKACGLPVDRFSVHMGMVLCDVCLPIAEPKSPYSFEAAKFDEGGDGNGGDGY